MTIASIAANGRTADRTPASGAAGTASAFDRSAAPRAKCGRPASLTAAPAVKRQDPLGILDQLSSISLATGSTPTPSHAPASSADSLYNPTSAAPASITPPTRSADPALSAIGDLTKLNGVSLSTAAGGNPFAGITSAFGNAGDHTSAASRQASPVGLLLAVSHMMGDAPAAMLRKTVGALGSAVGRLIG